MAIVTLETLQENGEHYNMLKNLADSVDAKIDNIDKDYSIENNKIYARLVPNQSTPNTNEKEINRIINMCKRNDKVVLAIPTSRNDTLYKNEYTSGINGTVITPIKITCLPTSDIICGETCTFKYRIRQGNTILNPQYIANVNNIPTNILCYTVQVVTKQIYHIVIDPVTNKEDITKTHKDSPEYTVNPESKTITVTPKVHGHEMLTIIIKLYNMPDKISNVEFHCNYNVEGKYNIGMNLGVPEKLTKGITYAIPFWSDYDCISPELDGTLVDVGGANNYLYGYEVNFNIKLNNKNIAYEFDTRCISSANSPGYLLITPTETGTLTINSTGKKGNIVKNVSYTSTVVDNEIFLIDAYYSNLQKGYLQVVFKKGDNDITAQSLNRINGVDFTRINNIITQNGGVLKHIYNNVSIAAQEIYTIISCSDEGALRATLKANTENVKYACPIYNIGGTINFYFGGVPIKLIAGREYSIPFQTSYISPSNPYYNLSGPPLAGHNDYLTENELDFDVKVNGNRIEYMVDTYQNNPSANSWSHLFITPNATSGYLQVAINAMKNFKPYTLTFLADVISFNEQIPTLEGLDNVLVVFSRETELTDTNLAAPNGSEYIRINNIANTLNATLEKIYPSLSITSQTIFACLKANDGKGQRLESDLKKRPYVLATSLDYPVYPN